MEVTPEGAKRIAEFEEKMAELTRARNRIESEVRRSEEYRKLESRLKQIRKEQGEITREENELTTSIYGRYTDDDRRPSYSRGDSYTTGMRTNISAIVMAAIREVVGPTSKLKAGQIEELVEDMMKIDRAKPEYKDRFSEIDKRQAALMDEDTETYGKQDRLESEATEDIRKRSRDLKQQIDGLREAERKPRRQAVEAVRIGYKEKVPALYARIEQMRSSTTKTSGH